MHTKYDSAFHDQMTRRPRKLLVVSTCVSVVHEPGLSISGAKLFTVEVSLVPTQYKFGISFDSTLKCCHMYIVCSTAWSWSSHTNAFIIIGNFHYFHAST